MASPRALRTPPARGTRTVCMPSSSARAQACIPPAPPKARRANSRGIEAALDADHPAAPAPSPRWPPARCPSAVSSASRPSFFAEGGEGLLREFAPQHHLAAQLRPVGEVAEEQVGVGHGGLLAALAVGGGARFGAGGVGADAQGAAGVGPGYRAAARAHGVHVHHRVALWGRRRRPSPWSSAPRPR